MTSAMQRSWRPGGPSRIAYDKRMQDKKTSSETYRTPITVAEMKKAIGQPAPHYPIPDIVKCMRISARVLELADNHDQYLNGINTSQAHLLRAAADDLESQTAWSDQ